MTTLQQAAIDFVDKSTWDEAFSPEVQKVLDACDLKQRLPAKPPFTPKSTIDIGTGDQREPK